MRLRAEAGEGAAPIVLPVRQTRASPDCMHPDQCSSGASCVQDMSDNPGGGGTSDSVVILQEMLERGVTNAVVATIVDPAVVEQAHAAGVGAQISGLLGDARSACRRLVWKNARERNC